MADRSMLADADVDDTQLTEMVARQLGHAVGDVAVATCEVEEVPYDIPAITTAGRWWVRGEADTSEGARAFAFFVKQVQGWQRSPIFERVPHEFREAAAASFPWRTEAAVYRSDLDERLPDGLGMPTAYAVKDIDDLSFALWLEVVPAVPVEWDLDRFARAAHLLGRLAGSARVAPLATVGDFPFRARDYVDRRLAMQVGPALRTDLWEHPAIAAAFDADLRDRVLDSLDHLEEWADEVDALPRLTMHGDACPNNLLVTAADPHDFVLIDYGMWNRMPVGFDLGQLLLGDVVLGRRPASSLAATEEVIVAAYVEGLHVEGCDVPEETVRRAHALLMYLFNGVSAMPMEELEQALPPSTLLALARQRAAVTRFCLDLVEATSA